MYLPMNTFLPDGITYALLSFYCTLGQDPAETVITKAPL